MDEKEKQLGGKVSRLQFFKAAAALGVAATAAACGLSSEKPTPEPTQPEPEPTPKSTPKPEKSPIPEASPVPEDWPPIESTPTVLGEGMTIDVNYDLFPAVGDVPLKPSEQGQGKELDRRYKRALVTNWKEEFRDGVLFFSVSSPDEEDRRQVGAFFVVIDEAGEGKIYLLVEREGEDRIEMVVEPALEAFTGARDDWNPEERRVNQLVTDINENEHLLFWNPEERAWVFTETGEKAAQYDAETGNFTVNEVFQPQPTATPEPTEAPEPTRAPSPEVVPSNEICAVGELEGRCYQRTEMRKGVFPDGNTEPNGTMAIYASDPDRRICGAWMLGGRVNKIDLVSKTVYLQGRGGDIIKIRVAYDSPYFYSRMKRYVFGVPWREANPEVHPELGKDIIAGDYLSVTCPGVGIKNNRTPDENYQKVMEAMKAGTALWTATLQIYQ